MRLVWVQQRRIAGQSLRILTYPNDLHVDRPKYSALIAGHISRYHTGKRYFHKNGSVIWVALSIALVRKECGSQDFYIYQVNDVTEKKSLEARQKVFFDHSANLFAVGGVDGYVEQVNAAWTRALGWLPSE